MKSQRQGVTRVHCKEERPRIGQPVAGKEQKASGAVLDWGLSARRSEDSGELCAVT